ncbi:MAG: hypothetical protein ACRDZ4_20955 [Egibacteraceae bacterium]
MPTFPYYSAKGDRLPGVTWVIGQNLGWNKDALMRWANREGIAGRDIRGDRSASKVAADVGTAVHTMIEAHAQGWDPVAAAGSQLTDLSEADQAKVRSGYDGFKRWFRNNRLVVVGTELHGVDEEYQTGFCLDALALEDTEGEKPDLALVDWKSSKGTYADHFIQVSAYTRFTESAIARHLGVDCRLSGAHVLRVSKDHGTFHHTFWSRGLLDDGWRAFTWARALHQIRPQIESYVR